MDDQRHREVSIKAGHDGSWYTLADLRRVEESERQSHNITYSLNPDGTIKHSSVRIGRNY
jgi:hypothetical protein